MTGAVAHRNSGSGADGAPRAGAWVASGTSAVIVVVAVAVLWGLALYRLRGMPYSRDFAVMGHAIWELLPVTGWTALKVAEFWGLTGAVLAGLLLRFDPALDVFDAALAGAAGVWVTAYVGGTALGPIGLFRAPVIWIALAAGAISLVRRPPAIRAGAPSFGQKLALLAFALSAIGLLPLQLASPIVPTMDALSWPAAAQRIVTFGVYLPFNNDPYGCWGPNTQTPALELFYALLTMATHTRLAVLAESATILPMTALMIFATYRLGASLLDDTGGGAAALLLAMTTIFRKIPSMRGTAVAVAMVAVGLAFFLDRRRSRTLMALGAIALGTAIASHAIEGGLGLIAAGAAVILWLAARDLPRFIAGAACLGGAVLIAAPELAIATSTRMPAMSLPLFQIAGIGVICGSAANFGTRPLRYVAGIAVWLMRASVVALIVAVAWQHASMRGSIYEQLLGHFPLLSLFTFGGLIVLLANESEGCEPSAVWAIVIALLLPFAAEYLLAFLRSSATSKLLDFSISDLHYKLAEYWTPFLMVLPAAALAALALERWSRMLGVLAMLALLIYPWRYDSKLNYDYAQHSIPEDALVDFSIASNGYWTGTPNWRWTTGPDELALLDVLRAERAAGMITPATHILHLTHDVTPFTNWARFAVFTGINADPMVVEPAEFPMLLAGGRVRHISKVAEAVAQRPPYILMQIDPDRWLKIPIPGYEQIFASGRLKLYRRRSPPVVQGE